MSEWAVPSGMTPQDNPERPKDGTSALVKWVKDNASAVADKFNNLLKNAGLHVTTAGLTIDSELLVTGATRIEGVLDLPAGIIGDEALTNPISPETFTGSASNFAVPHAATNLATASLTIPAGRTSAIVVATATAVLACREAGADSLHFLVRANATDGPDTFRVYAAYDQFGESVGYACSLTGLTPGGTLSVSARSYTGSNDWPTWAANSAHIDGVVLWLR